MIPGQGSQLFAALRSLNHVNVERKEFKIWAQNILVILAPFLDALASLEVTVHLNRSTNQTES